MPGAAATPAQGLCVRPEARRVAWTPHTSTEPPSTRFTDTASRGLGSRHPHGNDYRQGRRRATVSGRADWPARTAEAGQRPRRPVTALARAIKHQKQHRTFPGENGDKLNFASPSETKMKSLVDGTQERLGTPPSQRNWQERHLLELSGGTSPLGLMVLRGVQAPPPSPAWMRGTPGSALPIGSVRASARA